MKSTGLFWLLLMIIAVPHLAWSTITGPEPKGKMPQPLPSIVYSPITPANLPYPRGIGKSTRYQVLAKLAEDKADWDVAKHSTATYEAWPDYPDAEATVPIEYRQNYVHFAQIDANSRVRFRVELLSDFKIDRLSLKPTRYESLAQSRRAGKNWVEFGLDPSELTKHVLVEINAPTDSPILNHGLMVFLNPLSVMPMGKVLQLPSGVIDPSNSVMDKNHVIYIDKKSPYDAIYIPRDTIVNGRIQIDKENVKVEGRGMVVGSRWNSPKTQENWREKYPITSNGKVVKGNLEALNGSFEGITIVHPYHFNFVGGKTSTNLKAFGWRYSSDGIHAVDVAKGCFTRVNDDHIYFRNRVIEHNSFWALNNGTIFQGGWGSENKHNPPSERSYIAHNSILRTEWDADGGERQNNGIFGSVEQGRSDTKNVTFEDILIQGNTCRLLNFDMRKSSSIWTDFLFKDIVVENPLGCLPATVKPVKQLDNLLEIGGEFNRIRFENVSIGGVALKKADQLSPLKVLNVKQLEFK